MVLSTTGATASIAAGIPGPHVPLSTLRRCPREQLRMTRGRCGSLLHIRITFSFTTPRRFNRRTGRRPYAAPAGVGGHPSQTALRCPPAIQPSRRHPALLLPFKHEDVRLTSAHYLHGHRQGLEIGRKLDLLGVHDLTVDLVVISRARSFTRRTEEAEPRSTLGPWFG